MKTSDILNDINKELERYSASVSLINQGLRACEERVRIEIEVISACDSFEEIQRNFDELSEIQCVLSAAIYRYGFPLSSRLSSFVRHMDRDDTYSRKYWYERFRNGVKWPEED